jgi:uncharacterized protein
VAGTRTLNAVLAVCDTTALTTLLKTGHVDLLEQVFGSVVVPAAGATELLRYHPELPAFCDIRPVTESSRLWRLRASVHAGEADAICLALDIGADVLLIDDKKARRVAESEGLSCLALPAVLLAAKEREIITSITPLLNLMENRGSYRLTPAARAALLKAANE